MPGPLRVALAALAAAMLSACAAARPPMPDPFSQAAAPPVAAPPGKLAGALGRDACGGIACLPAAWECAAASAVAEGSGPAAMVRIANLLANDVPHAEDFRNWGVADHWATPREFFARGGDCEDYAVAEYALLRRMGFAAADLRLLVVRDAPGHHAVLAVRLPDGEVSILDSGEGRERPLTLTSAARYEIVYAANEAAVWVHPAGDAILADAAR